MSVDVNENLNENLETEKVEQNSSFEQKIEFSGNGYNNNPVQRNAKIMTDDEYIAQRLDVQMNWYDNKASFLQKKYKKLKRWEIAIAASIPVLIGFAAMSVLEHTVLIKETVIGENGVKKLIPYLTLSTLFQIVAAIGGVVIIILKGINDLEEYQKNWKEYRASDEALKQEKFKYLTRTEPYDEIDAYPIFVEKIESILSKERQQWKVISKATNEISEKAQESLTNQMKKFEEGKDAKKDTEAKG